MKSYIFNKYFLLDDYFDSFLQIPYFDLIDEFIIYKYQMFDEDN